MHINELFVLYMIHNTVQGYILLRQVWLFDWYSQLCKVLVGGVSEHVHVWFVGPRPVQLWEQLRPNLAPEPA